MGIFRLHRPYSRGNNLYITWHEFCTVRKHEYHLFHAPVYISDTDVSPHHVVKLFSIIRLLKLEVDAASLRHLPPNIFLKKTLDKKNNFQQTFDFKS